MTVHRYAFPQPSKKILYSASLSSELLSVFLRFPTYSRTSRTPVAKSSSQIKRLHISDKDEDKEDQDIDIEDKEDEKDEYEYEF